MSDSIARILIIDDDPDDMVILTDDLADCGYEVWTASDGEHALAQAQAWPVDIALLDVRLPRLTGIELIPQLQALLPEVMIILLTNYATISQAVEVMQLGAFDYLEKPVDPQQLRSVVTRAWQSRQVQAEVVDDLTRREQAVMRLLAEGRTDSEIAGALQISAQTASTHVRNILSKLNVDNRVQAAVCWVRHVGKG
jgi:DNA-binding NarL/FixJ family response regulator